MKKLEYVKGEDTISGSFRDTICSKRDDIKAQIRVAQNSEILYKYLLYIDSELGSLHTKCSEDFSLKIILLFSELFQDGIGYDSYERREILQRFHIALGKYHKFFPEKKGQNYFRADTPTTLMILGDTGYIAYSVAGAQGYKFI